MSRKAYPLEIAHTLRTEEETSRANELTNARRRLELAVNERSAIEAALAVHREETARIVADERLRDRQGRCVEEMLRAQSFLDRRRRKELELAQRLERARAQEREARTFESDALAAFTLAAAERKAVERHRAAWLTAREKEQEKKEEEENEEHRH
jgi:hypothetical protein